MNCSKTRPRAEARKKSETRKQTRKTDRDKVKKGKLGQDDEKQAGTANGERDKEESKRKSEERKTGAGKEPSGTTDGRKGSLFGAENKGRLERKSPSGDGG
jgi:hypothetical protein